MPHDHGSGDDRDELPELCREILLFLADHPRTQDSFEGIAEWWLLEREIQRESKRLRDALSWLVERGFLIENRVADGSTQFGVDQERLPEIRRLVARSGEDDG